MVFVVSIDSVAQELLNVPNIRAALGQLGMQPAREPEPCNELLDNTILRRALGADVY